VDDAAAIITALRQRFPNIQGPRKDDICYATQNRQDAVKRLAGQCDVVLVVGSPNSSNSNRLREVAVRSGKPAYLIDNAAELQTTWLQGKSIIGVSAGASAPEILVEQVLARLEELGATQFIMDSGVVENQAFPLPRELR